MAKTRVWRRGRGMDASFYITSSCIRRLRHVVRRYACVACTLSDRRRNIEHVLHTHVTHAHAHTFIEMRDARTYLALSSWHAFRMEKRIASRATVLSSTSHCCRDPLKLRLKLRARCYYVTQSYEIAIRLCETRGNYRTFLDKFENNF